ATDYIGNPFLYIKFPAIGLGLLNVVLLNFLPAWKERKVRNLTSREQLQLAVAGGVSLLCWLNAITAGRKIRYWGILMSPQRHRDKKVWQFDMECSSSLSRQTFGSLCLCGDIPLVRRKILSHIR